MENQLIAAVAVFVLGYIAVCMIIGYISLWVNYPIMAVFTTVVIILLIALSMWNKSKRLKQ